MYMEVNNQSESFCRVKNKVERKNIVLITDDEPSVQRILIKQLTILGCDCQTASNGVEALRKIDGNNYDLVLLDINMPGMTGLEVLKEARNLNHNTTIVMISSLGSVELVRGTLREGAYDYLIKPWGFEELEVMVKGV